MKINQKGTFWNEKKKENFLLKYVATKSDFIHRVKLFSDVFTKYSETNKNVLMSSLFINEKRGM